MQIQIPNSVFRVILLIPILCFLCICSLVVFGLTNYTSRLLVEDLFRDYGDTCDDRFFANSHLGLENMNRFFFAENPQYSLGLINTNGLSIFDKAYNSPEELITNYPWFGQYMFGSPGQPHCQMNLNPFYGKSTKFVEWIGPTGYFIDENITSNIGQLDDYELVYTSDDGYIVIHKIDGKFYSRGFHGFYFAP